MLLGGLRYLLPVINAAHKLGYHVITCDYIPENIAHKYSDEYHNVSITDKEKVTELARRLKIDGIMSFAVDPGVVTAAYVQQEMSLPGNPYDSVCILQNKARFRKFLKVNGFNTPDAIDAHDLQEALEKIADLKLPVIVKPVDSAGSKGVSRIDSLEELPAAFINAQEHSLTKTVIIEEFIETDGYSSDSDCFSIDGKLLFTSFSSQRFDFAAANPYTPAAYSWPSSMHPDRQNELKSEIQRLLKLLDMGTSIYNVETRIGKDGKAYIMEISPRGGGNRISEILKLATGVDLISASVKAAVGETITDIASCPYSGYWAEVIIHSGKNGIFKSLDIDKSIKDNIVETDLWVRPGDKIQMFNGANDSLGTIIMKFDSQEKLEQAIAQRDWLNLNYYE